jgi:alkylation response protein AidB-like acyl-CoA dehydrogenase
MRADNADTAEEAAAALLQRLAHCMLRHRQRANMLDEDGAFPSEDVASLAEAGALGAVVPTLMGGLGIGTEPARFAAASDVLQCVGAGSVALGRVFEGHLNAVRLVMRYGNDAQRRRTSSDARNGLLHALWVTDGAAPLSYRQMDERIELVGEKSYCSAAGYASRAVVTALSPEGERRLLILPLQNGEVVHPLDGGLQGVRSAGTGCVQFPRVPHRADCVFGEAESYLNEPEFSAGAWRASAVATGALACLVETARAELVARGRAGNPEQRQRLGRMFVNAQTARLWLLHAAKFAEDADAQPDLAVATVNLARTAIEVACTDTIQLVQRSLGLSAFLRSNPVERMCRDLATYLRQPAPDEAFAVAAAYFTARSETDPP